MSNQLPGLKKGITAVYQRFQAGNLFYKLLAVLLAVLLWGFASGERQVKSPDRVLEGVPVQTVGLREGLVLVEGPGKVQVTLRGESAISVHDLIALVDLSNSRAGEATLPVQVTAPPVVSVKPAKIKLRLDNWLEKQVPVEVSLSGRAREGMMTLAPLVRPSQVTLRGGESILASIQRAQVDLELKEADKSISQTLPLRVCDHAGNPIPGVQLYPSSVEVLVPVIREQPGKMVAVQPNLTGSPTRGYQLAQVKVEPALVKVFAPPEVLARVDHLTTGPVSIQGVKQSVEVSSLLVLPAGVEAVEPAQVLLRISVEPGAESPSRTLTVGVQADNLGRGLECTLQPSEVAVEVTGPAERLASLTESDLRASIDLAGQGAGEHRLTVSVSVPSGISVVQADPAEVTAKVRAVSTTD